MIMILHVIILLRSICLQWVLLHYEVGDFKPRRKWENFPNQCICSLMMKFPNGEDSWFLRMVSRLGFECKSGNMTFLIRSKTNTSFRPPELVLTYDMWLQAFLGFFRVLLLPEWMTLALEVMDLNILTKVILGSKSKACGGRPKQFLALPFITYQLDAKGLADCCKSTWPPNYVAPKIFNRGLSTSYLFA